LQDPAIAPYHFIYIDPPYEIDGLDVIETLIQLQVGGFLHPQALIAVERNSRVKEISWPDGYISVREKNYGQVSIFYGAPADSEPENG
jgi:16S rRNA (guanine966-N2)-methyltransferase